MKCQCSVNVYQMNKDIQLLLTIKLCFKMHSQFQPINRFCHLSFEQDIGMLFRQQFCCQV